MERTKAPHSAREEGVEGRSNGKDGDRDGDRDGEGPVCPQLRLSFIGFFRQTFSPVQYDRHRRIKVALVDLDRRYGGGLQRDNIVQVCNFVFPNSTMSSTRDFCFVRNPLIIVLTVTIYNDFSKQPDLKY